jgi:hypothetical protein
LRLGIDCKYIAAGRFPTHVKPDGDRYTHSTSALFKSKVQQGHG